MTIASANQASAQLAASMSYLVFSSLSQDKTQVSAESEGHKEAIMDAHEALEFLSVNSHPIAIHSVMETVESCSFIVVDETDADIHCEKVMKIFASVCEVGLALSEEDTEEAAPEDVSFLEKCLTL